VNVKRASALAGIAAVSAFSLAACGGDPEPAGVAGGSSSNASCDGKDQLSASGSSAQANAMDAFIAAYNAVCGKDAAYTSSGSGDGRTQFAAGNTDFGGTDSPIKDEQLAQAEQRCGGNDVWNLPLVFGPVGVGYNVPGVEGIALNAETIAKIFNGTIRTWNDPAIAAQNEGVDLPAQDIAVIHRSDSSGTTDNFQKYLEVAGNGAWTSGAGSDFTGGIGNGFKGNEGISQAVAATPGSIGYMEKSYIDQNNLQAVRIDNGSGPVELNAENAARAVEQAEFASTGGGDLTLDLNSVFGASEPDTYPLVLVTYEIVCSQGYDPETAAAVKSFLTVASNEGQVGLEDYGYVPLPEAFKEKLATSIDQIS
jgi:phosphate transport system substrate-binding protein